MPDFDVQYKIAEPNGDPGLPLNDVVSWGHVVDRVDPGAGGGTFWYPRGGQYSDLLAEKTELVLLVNNEEPEGCRILLQDWADDLVLEGDRAVRVRKWTTTSIADRLREGLVLPAAGANLAEDRTFVGTPGAVFAEIFDQNQNHGLLSELSLGFTATTDAGGGPWTIAAIEITLKVGTTVLAVAELFATMGWAQLATQGREIRLYNLDAGTDWSDTDPSITLQRGYDLLDGPVVSSAREFATRAYVMGDGGRFVIVNDLVAQTADGGRVRAVPINGAGLTDPAQLTRLGEQHLSLWSKPRRSHTYGLAVHRKHLPLRDFGQRDWVGIRDGGSTDVERYRVRRFELHSTETPALPQVNLTVDDWLAELDEQTATRLERLQAGTPGEDGPPAGPDRIAPAQVTGLVVTTETYDPPVSSGGVTLSRFLLTWAAVTLDEDGQPCYDLDGFRVRWRYSGRKGWNSDAVGKNDTDAQIQAVQPGRQVDVEVAAVDVSGNVGAAAVASPTAATDHGGFRAYDDTTGEELLDTRNGARVKAPLRFTIGRVPGGGGLRGVGVAATTNGIELDEVTGFRIWNPAGVRTFWADAATGDLTVEGNAAISGTVAIGGSVGISGTVTITGNPSLIIAGTTTMNGTLTINAALTVAGTTTITGGTTINGNLNIAAGGTLTVAGAASFSSTLNVTGTTTLGGTLTLNANLNAAGFKITGAVIEGSSLKTTAGASGSITIIGDVINFAGAGSLSASTDGTFQFAGGSLTTFNGLQVGAPAVGAAAQFYGTVGFMGAGPRGVYPVGPLCTDLATVKTLANNLRNALIAFGLCTT